MGDRYRWYGCCSNTEWTGDICDSVENFRHIFAVLFHTLIWPFDFAEQAIFMRSLSFFLFFNAMNAACEWNRVNASALVPYCAYNVEIDSIYPYFELNGNTGIVCVPEYNGQHKQMESLMQQCRFWLSSSDAASGNCKRNLQPCWKKVPTKCDACTFVWLPVSIHFPLIK